MGGIKACDSILVEVNREQKEGWLTPRWLAGSPRPQHGRESGSHHTILVHTATPPRSTPTMPLFPSYSARSFRQEYPLILPLTVLPYLPSSFPLPLPLPRSFPKPLTPGLAQIGPKRRGRSGSSIVPGVLTPSSHQTLRQRTEGPAGGRKPEVGGDGGFRRTEARGRIGFRQRNEG
ncbi:hypothetical protein E2C01_087036 [Portunus trituberculatus]|uniref:Uncharacterized protein n=1 Tax=Portunus trituberculatus TaxID=210409 RepID=A0A5B7JAX8_PORTR|nr:hypothetical protein [Portunus trituberculatus]